MLRGYLCGAHRGGQRLPGKKDFTSHDAQIDGVTIHYTKGGARAGGTPAARICGNIADVEPDPAGTCRETDRSRRISSRLGVHRFPRRNGHEDRGDPDLHDLVRSPVCVLREWLGTTSITVAYAYAAQFPSEMEKLVLMDAFLPGVEG